MSGLGPIRLAIRGARPAAGVSLLVAALVLLASFLAISGPRQLDGVLTSSLRSDLAGQAGGTALQVQLTDESIADPETGIAPVWAGLADRLAQVRDGDPDLRRVTDPGEFTGTAGGAQQRGFFSSGTPTTPAGIETSLTLEAAPSLRDEARLVDGRWPGPIVAGAPLEVVVAAKAADRLRWRIGQTQTFSGGFDAGTRTVVLVGTIAPRDPAGAFWGLAYSRAQVKEQRADGGDTIIDASTVWVDPAGWPDLVSGLAGGVISAWYPIDARALTIDSAAAAGADVRRFVAKPQPLSLGPSDQPLGFRSGLPAALAESAARSGPPTALMALFALGPAGALAAVLLLGLRLRGVRRGGAVALTRARGGSLVQRGALGAAEVAVWTVPAAVVGAVVAALLVPTGGSLAGAVAVAAVLGLAAPALSAVLPPQRDPRDAPSAARAAALVASGAAVLVAALAIVVVVARGPTTAASGVDPLVELAPLLLAIAATVLVARVAPVLGRWAGAALRTRRGAVALVAASRSGAARGGAWVLFALVIGVGMSTFSLTMVATQQRGVEQAALNRVGSDIAVSGDHLDPDAVRAIERLPGVTAHATIRTAGSATVGTSDIAVYVADAGSLALVQRGIDDPPLGPLRGADAIVTDLGTPPAAAQLDGVGPKRFRLHPVDPRAVSIVFSEPRWVLVDRTGASETDPDAPIAGELLRLRDGADPARVATVATRLAGPGSVVTAAAAAEAEIVGTPLDRAVHTTIVISTALTALLGALVFAMTLAAATADRMRRGAILRALGFDARRIAALVLADVVPIAVLGVLTGGVTGAGAAAALLHTIDPDGFVGAPIAPAFVLDSGATALVLVGFVAVAAAAAVVAMLLDLARPATAGLQTLGEER